MKLVTFVVASLSFGIAATSPVAGITEPAIIGRNQADALSKRSGGHIFPEPPQTAHSQHDTPQSAQPLFIQKGTQLQSYHGRIGPSLITLDMRPNTVTARIVAGRHQDHVDQWLSDACHVLRADGRCHTAKMKMARHPDKPGQLLGKLTEVNPSFRGGREVHVDHDGFDGQIRNHAGDEAAQRDFNDWVKNYFLEQDRRHAAGLAPLPPVARTPVHTFHRTAETRASWST